MQFRGSKDHKFIQSEAVAVSEEALSPPLGSTIQTWPLSALNTLSLNILVTLQRMRSHPYIIQFMVTPCATSPNKSKACRHTLAETNNSALFLTSWSVKSLCISVVVER